MRKTTLIIICLLIIIVGDAGFWLSRAIGQDNPTLDEQLVPPNAQWVQNFGDNIETRIVFSIKRLEFMVERHEQQIQKLINDSNDTEPPKKKRWF